MNNTPKYVLSFEHTLVGLWNLDADLYDACADLLTHLYDTAEMTEPVLFEKMHALMQQFVSLNPDARRGLSDSS